ncbi:unnamed protein product [Schistosoma turkestanicum]|nr:unnamed protein product [Schistosoma turkestanicum]
MYRILLLHISIFFMSTTNATWDWLEYEKEEPTLEKILRDKKEMLKRREMAIDSALNQLSLQIENINEKLKPQRQSINEFVHCASRFAEIHLNPKILEIFNVAKHERWTNCFQKMDELIGESKEDYTWEKCLRLAPTNGPNEEQLEDLYLKYIYKKENDIAFYNSEISKYDTLFEIIEDMNKSQ